MPGRNYRRPNGCWNCKSCFIKDDYDDAPEYYCTLGAPPRPLCGSISMDESIHSLPTDAEVRAAYDAWDAWRSGRGTDWSGTCDDWEPQDVKG
jgi:hypothetical protein